MVDCKQGCAPCKTQWLRVSKGVLPVKYFCSNNFFVSVEFLENNKCHKIRINLATPSFWDMTEFKTVVSVSLNYVEDFQHN